MTTRARKNDKGDRGKRKRTVIALERKVALAVPMQKKSPIPTPYMPGTDYGLVRRSNLRRKG